MKLSIPENKLARPPTRVAGEDFNARLLGRSQDWITLLDLEGRLLSMNAGGMKVLEIGGVIPCLALRGLIFGKAQSAKQPAPPLPGRARVASAVSRENRRC